MTGPLAMWRMMWLTRCWFFNWIVDSSKVITLGKKEGMCEKTKFWHKLTPGAFFTFLPTYIISFSNIPWKVPDILGML